MATPLRGWLVIVLPAIPLLLPPNADAQPADPDHTDERLGRTTCYLAEHGDLDIGFAGVRLDLQIHLHAGAIVDGNTVDEDAGFEPDELIVVATHEAKILRPKRPPWDSTGIDANEPLWVLPQHERENVPAFGLATKKMEPGVFLDNVVTLSLRHAKEPGEFSLWADDAFGFPKFALSTHDQRLSSTLPVTLHARYNWGFAEPGTYTMVFEVSGDLVEGGFTCGLGLYTFQVSGKPVRLEALPGDVNQDGGDETNLRIVEDNWGRVARVWPAPESR